MNKQTIMPTIGLMFSLALPLTATAQGKPQFDAVNFISPDDNIDCYGRLRPDPDRGNNSWVQCNIGNTGAIKIKKILQPRPKSCKTEWGASFAVDKNKKAHLICTLVGGIPTAFDKISNQDNTLNQIKVGQIVKGDGWICTGLSNGGIMCKNNKGNGFSISKDQQSIFNPSK